MCVCALNCIYPGVEDLLSSIRHCRSGFKFLVVDFYIQRATTDLVETAVPINPVCNIPHPSMRRQQPSRVSLEVGDSDPAQGELLEADGHAGVRPTVPPAGARCHSG